MADAETCALANNTKGMVILNLPHGLVPERSTMGVTGTRDYDPATGRRQVRAHKRPISGSITLLAKGTDGSTVANLPRTVLRAPDVQKALKSGAIKLVEVVAEPVAAPADPEGAATTEAALPPAATPTPTPADPKPAATTPKPKSGLKAQE